MASPIEGRLSRAFDDVVKTRGLVGFTLTPHVAISGYSVDFLLRYQNAAVAVECDGHDYHERTQQQASYDRARDRMLLKAGYPTIRFTGSDIFRDAEQCAIEMIDIADALSQRRDPVTPIEKVWLSKERAPAAPRLQRADRRVERRVELRAVLVGTLLSAGPMTRTKLVVRAGRNRAESFAEISSMLGDGLLNLDQGRLVVPIVAKEAAQ